MNIGVIGLGFVGQATYEGLRKYYNVKWCDVVDEPFGLMHATDDERTRFDRMDFERMLYINDIIFICVPTPMNSDGSANINIVAKVVADLDDIWMDLPPIVRPKEPIIVIKSTVPPGSTAAINENCELDVIFNPEFLKEATYLEDFTNQNYVLIGGVRPATGILKQMYTLPFPTARIIKTDSTYAELVKYMTNCFLATKVSFANEIKSICDHYNVDYDKVMEYALCDDRLGKSHWNVPGPDGHSGFGGTCFPKDMNAIMAFCRQEGISIPTIRGAWETNLRVRPERDWEQLKGRAVTF